MKTTVSQEGPTKVRISVEATPDEVAPAVERAFERLAGEVKVPGFRQGKVPRKVLEARLGADQIREASLQEAVPLLWRRAMTESDVSPISLPDIEVRSYDDRGLAFDALFEVRPEINLPDFSQISVERPQAAVTDEELDEQIVRLQDRFATLETITRPAHSGDFALIDLKGYVHDKEVPEASATDLLYEVGSERFVPELDRELEGKRQGDILKFNATLPETYPGESAGKEITFQVLVKEIRQKNLPALDDEFAKTASEFDTLDELRADVRTRIEELKRVSADAEVRNRLLEKVIEQASVPVPEALANDEMSYRAARLSDQLRHAGVSLEQYLERTGQTEEQITEDLRRQAERNVAAQLILDEVGKREELEASEEDVQAELLTHAQALQKEPDELRESLVSGGRLGALSADIIRRKALDLIVERAEVKEESKPA
ncbi:MAG: trigger factor [Actinomycetota bacterium]